MTVHQQSPEADKVRLFRSLFRGRDDVFARRFESRRTGRPGYAAACGNEWAPGICEKPRIKCGACRHQRFLPVSAEAVRWHLSGADEAGAAFVMAVYPLLADETCWLLAIDFDQPGWQAHAAAAREACRRLGLRAAVERSRSGRGGHLWLLFAAPVSAAVARRVGAHVLTVTMERHPELGFDAYDRMFPSQDTLPRGGFGSPIALPLQKAPRDRGDSVFLDDRMRPWADQWEFLSRLKRSPPAAIEKIAAAAEKAGRVVGVRLPRTDEDELRRWMAPSPAARPSRRTLAETREILITLCDRIYLPRSDLTPQLQCRLLRLAAFQNPAFYQAQAMRLPTFDKPRVVSCGEVFPDRLALPRGCLEAAAALLQSHALRPVIDDRRQPGGAIEASFRGALWPQQAAAAADLLAADTGVLAAATAFGKTVVAAWLIAQRARSTLVVVHRRQLLEQWVERLAELLELGAGEIGRLGGGRRRLRGAVDVALVQSLVRQGVVHDCVTDYGNLIVDECHHVPAAGFEQLLRKAQAKYVTGLTATVARRDGRHPVVFMQCGPARHLVDARRQAKLRPFDHRVVVRPTCFQSPAPPAGSDARLQYHDLCRQIAEDEGRTTMICRDVVAAVRKGRSPLVLTERTDHLRRLAAELDPAVANLLVLRGGLAAGEIGRLSKRLQAIPADQERVVLATGRFIGEGFDDPRLDTLFLAMPVSWRGTIAQYAGRLHRRRRGKQEVLIFDYADLNAPMLAGMFHRRCRGYEAIGYEICLPGNAVPGWPADVPLPAAQQWKDDYAGSVLRLTRDGVDRRLATLFSRAASPPAEDAAGAARARSASEEFLFRRLESLPATAGRFQLNARLPIAFDGGGTLEADLLCADLRLVVELDGAQHLESRDAYRRDRRKDLLLQENGYLVLRFLTEDVGRRLDLVLDTIVRGLEHQRHAGAR